MTIKILIISAFVFLRFGIVANAQCEKINAEVSIGTKEPNEKGTILIELNGIDVKKVSISLFGPGAKNQLGTQKTEFKGLESGKYIVVIAGKKEEDNFCPFSKEIIIN